MSELSVMSWDPKGVAHGLIRRWITMENMLVERHCSRIIFVNSSLDFLHKYVIESHVINYFCVFF